MYLPRDKQERVKKMKLAKLKSDARDPLYINPQHVLTVFEEIEKTSTIVFNDTRPGSKGRLIITMPIEETIKEINDALSNNQSYEELVKKYQEIIQKWEIDKNDPRS